jgi:hypothetical protein
MTIDGVDGWGGVLGSPSSDGSAARNISSGATWPGTAPSRSAIRRSSGSCSQGVIARFERPTIAPGGL